MLFNEQGEWESESDEDGAPIYDEEIGNDETKIQHDEGDNSCFISQRVLSVTTVKEENNQQHVTLDFIRKTECISYVRQDQNYTHMIDKRV
jgi:hypothetical protein